MSYAERAKTARQNQGFRPPEGAYAGRFRGWEFKRSNEGNPQFILDWKVLQGPNPETTARFQASQKMGLRQRFVLSVDFQFDAFLVLLEDMGADLSAIRSTAEDPEYVDFRALLDRVEKRPPDAELAVTYPKKVNPQYPNSYNLSVKKVEKVLEGQPAVAPVAPTAPVAPAPAPAAPAAPALTRESMLAAGWTDETLRANPQYAHLAAPALVVEAVPVPPAPPAPVAPSAPPAPPAPAPAGRKW